MPYVYESGEPVATGADGEHAYEFVSGEGLTDLGQSSYVFVSGTGIGGGAFVVGGESVGFFEVNQSLSDWQDARPGTLNEPNSVGWGNYGIADETGTRPLYIFGGYSTVDDAYSLCFWTHDPSEAINSFEATFHNSAANTTGIVPGTFDGEIDDINGTRGDGDFYVDMGYTTAPADGGQFGLVSGSYTITVQIDGTGTDGDPLPAKFRARGPNGNYDFSLSSGATLDVTINI